MSVAAMSTCQSISRLSLKPSSPDVMPGHPTEPRAVPCHRCVSQAQTSQSSWHCCQDKGDSASAVLLLPVLLPGGQVKHGAAWQGQQAGQHVACRIVSCESRERPSRRCTAGATCTAASCCAEQCFVLRCRRACCRWIMYMTDEQAEAPAGTPGVPLPAAQQPGPAAVCMSAAADMCYKTSWRSATSISPSGHPWGQHTTRGQHTTDSNRLQRGLG